MTKPRRRTQKIHRKRRGPRRGFKSRSQRGGENYFNDFNFSNLNPMNFFKTKDPDAVKASLYPNSSATMDNTIVSNNNNTFTDNNNNNTFTDNNNNNNTFTDNNNQNEPKTTEYLGGRRKRCKRHHKHSRRCKK
jgi:hypothetical protein